MATDRTFQDMLNEYLPHKLLKEELMKRNYVWSNIEHDEEWLGGTYIVPFRGGAASSFRYGSLTAENNIAESTYVRGQISTQLELWGSMKFNSRDLMEHGKLSEQNFLKLLPDEIEDFMDRKSQIISTNLLIGAHFATLTADATANDGNIEVDHPERFEIDQQVTIDDDDSVAITAAFVSSINMNTRVVNLVTTRGGATVVDFSAVGADMLVAQNAKVFEPGADTAAFSSLRDALLSSANGGSATLYGETKTDYPYLQAINIDGSGVTSANIAEKSFDAMTDYRNRAKGGRPTDMVMSLTNFGYVIKAVEASKGAFNVAVNSRKATQFGWEEIVIGSVTGGRYKFVGVQEMDDDIIIGLDWRALKFASNGGIQKERNPGDGNEFYTVRATTGYTYIVDCKLFGDLVVYRPSLCWILHSISI